MNIDLFEIYKNNIEEFKYIEANINKNGLILFGAGFYGIQCLNYMIDNGYNIKYIIDNDKNKYGNKLKNNIEILQQNDNKLKDSKIVIVTPVFLSSKEQIESLKIYESKLIHFNKWFTLKNFDKYLEIIDICKDKRSKEVLTILVYYYLTGDSRYNCFTYDDNQYFAIPQFKFSSLSEVFLNAGACTGDTVERFIEHHLAMIEHIYAFEPGDKQYNAMKKRIERVKMEWSIDNDRIDLIKAGLSNKNKKGYFNKHTNNVALNYISEEGVKDDEVQLYSIDDFLKNKNITFLAADVEGSEIDMLKGAINTIKRCKPKMAISAYHKPDDLFKIINLIKSIVPEYEFSIRSHTTYFGDMVLYCWTDQTRPDQTRPDQTRPDQNNM